MYRASYEHVKQFCVWHVLDSYNRIRFCWLCWHFLPTSACSWVSWHARSRRKSGHMDVSSWQGFALEKRSGLSDGLRYEVCPTIEHHRASSSIPKSTGVHRSIVLSILCHAAQAVHTAEKYWEISSVSPLVQKHFASTWSKDPFVPFLLSQGVPWLSKNVVSGPNAARCTCCTTSWHVVMICDDLWCMDSLGPIRFVETMTDCRKWITMSDCGARRTRRTRHTRRTPAPEFGELLRGLDEIAMSSNRHADRFAMFCVAYDAAAYSTPSCQGRERPWG